VRKADIEISKMPDEKGSGAHKSCYTDSAEMLMARAQMLTGKDKVLMQMYLADGSSFSEMARLMGANEATIARRVRKLTRRLLCGEYMTCLRGRRILSGLEKTIAKDYFLQGLSQEAIAQKMGITVYQVRKILGSLRALYKGKGTSNMSGRRPIRRKGHRPVT